jgi:hypothetical protein
MPVMMTPMMGNKLPDEVPWAADSGCFAAPHKFDPVRYITWLDERKHAADRCLFVTMPDVVGDARATLDAVKDWPQIIRGMGYRPALVGQDGLERIERLPWWVCDAFFVGGTTTWKLSQHAARLVREANERGKWTHMGRVNSLRRLRAAAAMGCQSSDGTYLAFGPDTNLPKLQGWLAAMERQPMLPLGVL